MSLLPTSATSDISTTEEVTKEYTDFLFNPETNEFTGEIGTGVEALKGWIYFALKVPRFRYGIYSSLYGSELEEIIGAQANDSEELKTTVTEYISEALLINPYIESIEDVDIEIDEEKIKLTCSVNTKYGVIYVSI